MKNNTLATIRNLSNEARHLFADILTAGNLASPHDFAASPDAWRELEEENLVNIWHDDNGSQYCEIGAQQ